MQNHYNLVYREEEREMIPLCIDQGVGVIPWSPLARGLLAGNRTREGERLTTRPGSDAFGDYLYAAEPTSTSLIGLPRSPPSAASRPAQVALAWLFHKPGVTAPIVGTTRPEHLTTRSPPSSSSSPSRRWLAWRSPTGRTPSSATDRQNPDDGTAPGPWVRGGRQEPVVGDPDDLRVAEGLLAGPDLGDLVTAPASSPGAHARGAPSSRHTSSRPWRSQT